MLSFRVLDTSIEMREFFSSSSSLYLFLRGERERLLTLCVALLTLLSDLTEMK